MTKTNFESIEAIVLSASEKHTHTLVWLPGVDSSAEEWKERFLDLSSPIKGYVKIIVLQPSKNLVSKIGKITNSWFD